VHQNRNGVQVFDGRGEGVRLGCTVAVVVGRALGGAWLAVGEGAPDEAEALGFALADLVALALTVAEGAAEVLAGAAVGASLAAGRASSTGAVIGRAEPLQFGAASASTPAPPRARPAAVRMTARRRFGADARRARRRRGSLPGAE
jgi:hypothetical protein